MRTRDGNEKFITMRDKAQGSIKWQRRCAAMAPKQGASLRLDVVDAGLEQRSAVPLTLHTW
jgi:hypothetical protein